MNKSTLQIIYMTFVLAVMSLFIASSSLLEVGKLFLIVVLSYMLFELTTRRRETSVFHSFNILFALVMIVFVVYALMYRGALFGQVRIVVFLLTLIGLAVSLLYTPKKRRVILPPHPIKRDVRKVKKTSTKKVTPKKVAKKPVKKVAKKVTKKSVKKVAKKKVVKKSTKRYVPTKTLKKKTTKKVAKKKVVKKAPKKVVKKAPAKKSTRNRSAAMDRNLISFDVDHEVAYVLRKFGKRITKKNKEKLVAQGKHFKSLKSYKPYNRASFYQYMKDKRVLSKLESNK